MISSARPTGGKVLLVNYAGYVLTGNTFVPDNSLATLAGVLRREGVPVEILDLQNPSDIGTVLQDADPTPATRILEQLGAGEPIDRASFEAYAGARRTGQERLEERVTREILDRVAHDGVGVIGFKLWAGNGLRGAVRMAEAIRASFPHVRLVAGGPAASYGRELILRRAPVFDAVCYGDGEEAILAFARGRIDAPGVLRLEGGRLIHTPARSGRNLDHVPAPVYSTDVYPNIDRFYRMRILEDSRGCFNKCAFCAHTHLSGVTRLKTPRSVVDEMEQGLREGIRYFRLSGSNPPRKFLEKVAREILERRLDVCYGVYSSMNNIRPASMPLLSESGCRGLFFGIESADPEHLRRAHNKNNIGFDHMVQVAEAAMREGIFTCTSAIVPGPFETAGTKRATLELLQAMFARYRYGSAVVLPALLTPGSTWWEQPAAYGFELAPGWNRTDLALRLLEWDANFLLPRELADDAAYSLDGKSCSELFEENQQFIDALEQSGIPTNMDDASFMVGLMGNMGVRSYKAAVLSALVRGGTEALTGLVTRMNAAAGEARTNVQAA